jgi:hypothetical protein
VSSSKRPSKKPAARAAPPARRRSTGPPASARLTIKPGPPGRTRSVDLPPRPRPGGKRRLSEIALEEDEILTGGFDATLDGVIVRVTAVLERTCVYQGKEGERRLANKKDLWIEADKLPIRRRGLA